MTRKKKIINWCKTPFYERFYVFSILLVVFLFHERWITRTLPELKRVEESGRKWKWVEESGRERERESQFRLHFFNGTIFSWHEQDIVSSISFYFIRHFTLITINTDKSAIIWHFKSISFLLLLQIFLFILRATFRNMSARYTHK